MRTVPKTTFRPKRDSKRGRRTRFTPHPATLRGRSSRKKRVLIPPITLTPAASSSTARPDAIGAAAGEAGP